MKKLNTNIFVLIGALATSSIGHSSTSEAAHHSLCQAYTNYEELPVKKSFASPECDISQDLKQVSGLVNYSVGTYMADYWIGSYSREVILTHTTRISTYACTGELVSTQLDIRKSRSAVNFSIKNPNTRFDASPLEFRAPLSRDETAREMQITFSSCKNAELVDLICSEAKFEDGLRSLTQVSQISCGPGPGCLALYSDAFVKNGSLSLTPSEVVRSQYKTEIGVIEIDDVKLSATVLLYNGASSTCTRSL